MKKCVCNPIATFILGCLLRWMCSDSACIYWIYSTAIQYRKYYMASLVLHSFLALISISGCLMYVHMNISQGPWQWCENISPADPHTFHCLNNRACVLTTSKMADRNVQPYAGRILGNIPPQIDFRILISTCQYVECNVLWRSQCKVTSLLLSRTTLMLFHPLVTKTHTSHLIWRVI